MVYLSIFDNKGLMVPIFDNKGLMIMVYLSILPIAHPRITSTIEAIYFGSRPLATALFYSLLSTGYLGKKRAARESPGSSGSHRAAQPHAHFFSLKPV
jgi:hypothetical protein